MMDISERRLKSVRSTVGLCVFDERTEMKLSDLLQSVTQNTASIDGISWYPVRPMTAENTFFPQRLKAAWRVLTGKSDAVEWDYPTERKTHNNQHNAPPSGGRSTKIGG